MEYEIEKLGYNPARAESIERYAHGLRRGSRDAVK